MSYEFIPIDRLLRRPYKFTEGLLGRTIHRGIVSGDALRLRPEKDHVVTAVNDSKARAIARTIINRSLDTSSPFEAGMLFKDGIDLENVNGYAVVNRNIKVVEHVTRNPGSRAIGPQVDTCSVVLFENTLTDMEPANISVICRQGLRRPVSIEPVSSDEHVHKALLEVYGPGTTGPFSRAIAGRPVTSTAYGVTI